jgi:hypothetical protein
MAVLFVNIADPLAIMYIYTMHRYFICAAADPS